MTEKVIGKRRDFARERIRKTLVSISIRVRRRLLSAARNCRGMGCTG